MSTILVYPRSTCGLWDGIGCLPGIPVMLAMDCVAMSPASVGALLAFVRGQEGRGHSSFLTGRRHSMMSVGVGRRWGLSGSLECIDAIVDCGWGEVALAS